MTDGPILWYLNRGTGVVVLVLLTVTTVLGVVALGNRSGRRLPRFVTQAPAPQPGAAVGGAARAARRRPRWSTSTSTSAGGRRSCRSARRTSRCGWAWARSRST